MKLNNKGFGMRETLVYLSVLLLILLIASCSISSFYDDLEESKNEEYVPSYLYDTEDDEDNDVVDDEEEDIVINYTPYYLAEAKFRDAVEVYAEAYSLYDGLTTVKLEDVDNAGYLEQTIVDSVDGSKCTGYANVQYDNNYGSYDIDVYISCSNYKTEGYR